MNVNRATMRIVTLNDDFTDWKTDLPHIDGGVVMVQEAKKVNVRGVVDRDAYRVFQNREDDAHAGSALYWRRDRFKTLDTRQKLLAKSEGRPNDDMLDRYVSWSDMQVRGKNVKVRMASAHRPPLDEPDEQREFDKNLKAFADKARRDHIPLVIGMDANFPRAHRDQAIRRLEKLTGLQWHGAPGGIDGFLVSKGVRFNDTPHREMDHFSDHDPVAASITVFANPKHR